MKSAETGALYDELVTRIYGGALEDRPWQDALPALRQAELVRLVLKSVATLA